MIREVDLVEYLPEFLKEFKELKVTLEAENPEFVLVWEATDRLLKNEFIETADEYGISRFEKLLGILPSSGETLEGRRAVVMSRWFDALPYTYRMLLKKLETLCGDSDFVVTHDFETGYTIHIVTNLEMYGQVVELNRMLQSVLPANIRYISDNEITAEINGDALFRGGVVYCDKYTIPDVNVVSLEIK